MNEEEKYPLAWYLDHNFRVGSTGFKVKTYTGKTGRTYHNKELVSGKMPVYIEGMKLPMLCDPDTLRLLEFIKK
jgi:hypothetical protein